MEDAQRHRHKQVAPKVDGEIVFGRICKQSPAVSFFIGQSDRFIKRQICKDRTQFMWNATSKPPNLR